MLTETQKQALAAALRAETNQTAIDAPASPALNDLWLDIS